MKKLKKGMKMNSFGLIFGLAAWALNPTIAVADQSEARPNIVLILADDLGYGDLSCYGQTNYQTPSIDRLAEEGILATDFYVPVPYCGPSRAALLTGRFPFRNGMTRNPHPGTHDHIGLSPDEITLGEAFGKAGYATTCIGKWHLGHVEPFLPAQQGFENYFGILYSNDMLPVRIFDRDQVVEDPADQNLLTRKYTDRAITFIQENKDTPFFLYFAHAMPHKPLAASEAYYSPETPDDLYADVIREMDGSVGEIRAALERAGILEQTIFIFMSDNGPSWGGSTGGLKGMKATAWEGGVKVPFVIRYPTKLPSGRKVSTPLWSLDLFPTLLKMAGIALPEMVVLDGDDIAPVLKGEKIAERPIFTAHNEKVITVREGKWKLYLNNARFQKRAEIAAKAWINPWPDGKNIIAPKEQPGPQQYPGLVPEALANPLPLFDLDSDPGEAIDLAEKHPEVVQRLKLSYQKFIDSMPDQITETPEAASLRLKVASFNIRYHTPRDKGDNHWDIRKDRTMAAIRHLDADVIGLQEALISQIHDMKPALTDYGRVGVGRDDGREAGETCSILYRKNSISEVDHGTFWLSDTPEVAGSKHWGNEVVRICTWALLKDKATGRRFYVYNCHFDHVSQDAREQSSRLVAHRIANRDYPSAPFILTGDFNAAENNPAIRYLKGESVSLAGQEGEETSPVKMVDSFRVLNPDATEVRTGHGFTGKTVGGKIDHVFIPPGTKVEAAAINDFKQGELFPSDHFPVTATLVFPAR